MSREKQVRGFNGWAVVLILIALVPFSIWRLLDAVQSDSSILVVLGWVLLLIVDAVCWAGLTVVNPNEARVITLFGVYKGSIKDAGFWWVNPLTTRRKLSLRVRNFESGRLKVNDRDGNPIEIAAVVVWRIVETFEATFNVNDYENFMACVRDARSGCGSRLPAPAAASSTCRGLRKPAVCPPVNPCRKSTAAL